MIENVEGGALKLKDSTAAGEQGSENNAVAMEMSLSAQQQMASESLELEEDEEKAQERLPPPLHLPGELQQHSPYAISVGLFPCRPSSSCKTWSQKRE